MRLIQSIIGLFILSVGLLACSGYQVKRNQNPFAIYQVHSVGLPMLVNMTSMPNVSSAMTREIFNVLSAYPGLKVLSGESKKADAILIGILTSDKTRNETQKTGSTSFINDPSLRDSIGDRAQFYIPTSVNYKLKIRLVLIRDPSVDDVKLLQGDLAPFVRHPRILFNRELDISGGYGKVVLGNASSEQGGNTNFTRNKALFEKSWQVLARSTAQQIKDVILEAF